MPPVKISPGIKAAMPASTEARNLTRRSVPSVILRFAFLTLH
jgi:hypothetical protein